MLDNRFAGRYIYSVVGKGCCKDDLCGNTGAKKPKPMKTMIITGASRGIGAATAKLAAARGFAVVGELLL